MYFGACLCVYVLRCVCFFCASPGYWRRVAGRLIFDYVILPRWQQQTVFSTMASQRLQAVWPVVPMYHVSRQGPSLPTTTYIRCPCQEVAALSRCFVAPLINSDFVWLSRRHWVECWRGQTLSACVTCASVLSVFVELWSGGVHFVRFQPDCCWEGHVFIGCCLTFSWTWSVFTGVFQNEVVMGVNKLQWIIFMMNGIQVFLSNVLSAEHPIANIHYFCKWVFICAIARQQTKKISHVKLAVHG